MMIHQNILPGAILILSLSPLVAGQDRVRSGDGDRDRDRDRITRLEQGTVIPVRTSEFIDVERRDNRVYSGIVDQDVRGTNGAVAIPRGSTAELIVRVAPDNDLILDVESVTVNGQRYAIQADSNRIESEPDRSVVGAIVGAVSGGEIRGRAVKVPRDTVVTFRLERPMVMGVADRGVMREGHHYHDWYDERR